IDECEEEECHSSATCVNNPGSFVCNCNPGFIGDGVISCSDNCQVPYLFFSTSSGTFSYNTEESTSSPNMFNSRVNALLSFDDMNKRLYFYTANDEITSYNLNGSDLSTITIQNVEFFTVDGRNNLLYYHQRLQDRIFVYNITSTQSTQVGALSSVTGTKDMEVKNGYLYIAKASYPTIIRYNPRNESITPFNSTTGSAQSLSVDEYDNVIYWANYDGTSHRVMRTLLNGETVDLNITYSGEIDLTSDVFNFYVLVKADNRIDQYLKTSIEKQKNVTFNGPIEDLIIAYDEDECCVGTFCHMNATCSNYLGGLNCSCNDGFTGNGMDCEATNCSDLSCGQNQECVQVNNTFACVCKDGYEEPDCRPTTNCSDPSCGQNEECVLVNNTFTCVCKDGYEEPDCLRPMTMCNIPVVVYYGPSAINYQVTINNVTTSGSLGSGGAKDMNYDRLSRRLFYYVSGNFYSVEQDGSDLRDIGAVGNVDRFTVDGRNNIIYYINDLTDIISKFNMTNSAETDLGIRAKDIDMDSVNNYLVIVRTDSGSNIERYNVETEVVDAIKAGGDFPQDVSVDADNGVVYWVNVIGGSTFKVKSTSYAGVTIDLNITYTERIEIAQDEVYLYVLVVSNETIYKYRKNTWEQMGSIVVPSGTSGVEVAFDIDECCVGTSCHEQSTCANSLGNFTCICSSGYSGNGTFCEDINECEEEECHSSATCVNNPGSFVCNCNPGFIGDGVISCSDNCQVPYLFFSTSSGTFSYNTEESTSSPNMFNSRANALLSFDGMNKRLYFYTANDEITSYNLNGSDLSTITIQNVEFFTVDGRNNLLYYHQRLQDRIFVYNITSTQSTQVGALSSVTGTKDMEVKNGYLYIAKASDPTIIRYNPRNESITPFNSTTGSAQSLSVDEYDNVIYWVNYDGTSHRVMRTLLNGETVDLNITYSGEIDLTSDVLNIYVLVKAENRIDQYLKTSLEKQKNVTYNGAIEDLIIGYGEFHLKENKSIFKFGFLFLYQVAKKWSSHW
ncbi:fibrillin-2-like isoform X48, partial [Paramuricea clavata]